MLILLALISGILFACFMVEQFVIVVCISIVCVGILTYYSILHKTFKYIIIFLISFAVGVGVFEILASRLKPIDDKYADCMGKATVVSRKVNDSYILIKADNVEINGEDLDYEVQIYYYNTKDVGYTSIDVGDRIQFTIDEWRRVERFFEENGELNSFYADNNIKALVNSNNVDVLDYTPTIRTRLHNRIKSLMSNSLSNQNVETIYSAMFGDKSDLSVELYSAYRLAGVVHLLAVSGLHVGLMVAILSWVIKKLHINSVVSFIIIGIFLLFYCYLCNFTYSVLRASIMALVLSGAYIMFSEPDLISSLSLAGIIILCVFPQAIFSISALLSFGCVFGIATLSKPIAKLFSKLKFPNWLSNSLSMSLSTQIAILGVMCRHFAEIGFSGIIVNIVVLPMFSVLFSCAFAIIMLALIVPAISYLLFFVNPLFEIMNWVIIFVANRGHLTSAIYFSYLSEAIWFVLIAFVGRFNLSRKTNKLIACVLIMLVLSFQLVYY